MLSKISDLNRATPNCDTCGGEGWVCENHPDMPWDGDAGCNCGGAGMPCECNPLHWFQGPIDESAAGHLGITVNLPEKLGTMTGVECRNERAILQTTSGIPLIVPVFKAKGKDHDDKERTASRD